MANYKPENAPWRNRYQPKYAPGQHVKVISTTSKRRGGTGVIAYYCKGHYPNICRVEFPDGKAANFFDTSLEIADEDEKEENT